MRKVLVIQGPNLNLLGTRETGIYGSVTLEGIHARLRERGRELGVAVETFWSNSEGEIVDAIQGAAPGGAEALIVNPAGYTHTSVAIRDALLAVGLPYFEVHISNIHAREEFRRKSLISDGAAGIVIGFGWGGYLLALEGAAQHLERGGSR